MSHRLSLALGIAVVCAAVAGVQLRKAAAPERVFEVTNPLPQLAAMCPWREPESDLKILFPGATGFELETRILSGLRTGLAERLGRLPTAEENALHVYRITREAEFLGEVTTRRVKGTYGAVELVIATDAKGDVKGLLLQRLREPEAIAQALQSESWRKRFQADNPRNSSNTQPWLADLPEEARGSAEAIVEGVRSSLILLDASKPGAGVHLAGAHHP